MRRLLAEQFKARGGDRFTVPSATKPREHHIVFPTQALALEAIIDVALSADPWTALQLRRLKMRAAGETSLS